MTSDRSRCRGSVAGFRSIARLSCAPLGWDQSTGTDNVAHCIPPPQPFQAIDPVDGAPAAPPAAGTATVATATSAPIATAGRQDKAATVPIRCGESPPGAVPSETMTPRDRDGEPLALLTVQAHPDDEASKGAATVARYHDEGVRCVLVCCTGGEAGDILNPAVDTPEVRDRLAEVRLDELQASADAIGYDELQMLGYHDSGMPDTDVNARPDNFANAPLDEAVGRLVRIIRSERPQVIVTYADDRKFYPHHDHIRVHAVSLPAFDRAGDPSWYPEAGPVWQPSKLYYTGFSSRRVKALHEAYLARGEESP